MEEGERGDWELRKGLTRTAEIFCRSGFVRSKERGITPFRKDGTTTVRQHFAYF